MSSASAQEFTQVQSLTSHVLFAKEAQAAQQREVERRRIEDLNNRAQSQAVQLEQQAASVTQLGIQLQLIRDEKSVIDTADAFDAAILAGRPSLARTFLAPDVIVGIDARADAPPVATPADSAVISPPLSSAAGGVLARSNLRVHVEGYRATLISDGYSWNSRRGSLENKAGTWTYMFLRDANGWKIDGVSFVRLSLP